jgi:hypothetical protein
MRSPLRVLSRPFERAGRYDFLAERYGTEQPLPGPVHRRESVMFARTVAYKFCVDVAASSEGVFVQPRPLALGDLPALRIPWAEIVRVERTSLYWRPAVRLVVGEPEVGRLTMREGLWNELRRSSSHTLDRKD